MRRASEADVPAIRAFLTDRAARAMFPLSNLARFGLDGDHDYAPAMWITETDGAVTGVLAVGRAGTLMPALGTTDPAHAAEVLRGRSINGLIGPADEVRPLLAILGLPRDAAHLDRDEPHFTLDLRELTVPDGEGGLAPLAAADAERMILWRRDYGIEALGLAPDRALAEARKSHPGYIEAGSHRVLMTGARTLSVTGFNAELPEIVQVGGVYTPPDLRGRGYARRAVALHLAEARARGVARAVLFSASEAAARAYRAIGFRQIGHWSLVLFDTPQVVR